MENNNPIKESETNLACPEPQIKNDYDVKEDNDSPRYRWKRLWHEERSRQSRLLLVFLPTLLITFMVLFWGPVEIIALNDKSFAFTVSDALLPLGIAFLGVTAMIVLLVCLIFRGWFLDVAVSFIFSLAVCAYAQGMFMNRNLGLLDGSNVNWALHAGWAIANLAIWYAVIMIVLVIRFLNKVFWGVTIKFVSACLIVMQLAALFSALPAASDVKKKKTYYLTTKNEFQLSSKENTVVFVLDAFGQLVLEKTMEKFPDTMSAFHDFTRYDNHSTEVMGTFYAISYLLTRNSYDPTKPYAEYLSNNWSSPDTNAFYDALHDKNFHCQAFVMHGWVCIDSQQLMGKVDNITHDLEQINHWKLVRKMANVSLLRYVPYALKPSFWMSDYDFGDIIEGGRYTIDDVAFYQRLMTTKISVQNEHNSYLFYHLKGVHAPFNYNEFVEFVEAGVEREQNARGSLRIVEEYLRQMKELDIYDRSNIIITADHGNHGNPACIFMLKRAGETHDVVQATNAPVSQTDFWPTLASIMKLDSLNLGRPVFEYQEGEKRRRTTLLWMNHPEYPLGKKYNVLGAYIYETDARRTRVHRNTPPQAIYPLFDSYY